MQSVLKQGVGGQQSLHVFANSFAQQAGLRKERTPSGHSVIHLCCFPVSFLPNMATFLHLKKRRGKKVVVWKILNVFSDYIHSHHLP